MSEDLAIGKWNIFCPECQIEWSWQGHDEDYPEDELCPNCAKIKCTYCLVILRAQLAEWDGSLAFCSEGCLQLQQHFEDGDETPTASDISYSESDEG